MTEPIELVNDGHEDVLPNIAIIHCVHDGNRKEVPVTFASDELPPFGEWVASNPVDVSGSHGGDMLKTYRRVSEDAISPVGRPAELVDGQTEVTLRFYRVKGTPVNA